MYAHENSAGRTHVRRVTLYVKDSDTAVWDRAKDLAGKGDDSLSSCVTDALAAHVERKELVAAIEGGLTGVTLEGRHWNNEQLKRRVRFVGARVVEQERHTFYVTRSGAVVVEQVIDGHTRIATFADFQSLMEDFDSPIHEETWNAIAEAIGEARVEDIE